MDIVESKASLNACEDDTGYEVGLNVFCAVKVCQQAEMVLDC